MSSDDLVKLTDEDIRKMIKRVSSGNSTVKQASRTYGVTERRVRQLTGRTTPNPRKQKKRKQCRYEREHSGSLVHGDWHRTTKNHPYVIIWLDDASRIAIA